MSSAAGPPRSAPVYLLRRYVSGATQRSTDAIENIRRVCESHLLGRYDLRVVDIYQQPELAREANIVAAPTLIKQLPLPVRQLVGDLSDHERVLAALDLPPTSPDP